MKKLLALVLALVMTLSLCVVSSNAADFTDKADIDYAEAVEVMKAVGVLAGYEDGSFQPDKAVTRAEAAKIIAYLDLGQKTADALAKDVSAFADVSAGHWAAGYITYCYNAGYVSGVGNGNFDPNGQVTAMQFAKMLLCVLGYEADREGLNGADWALATAKLAAKNNLFKGNDAVSANVAATRQEVAQYAMNALKATCVEYDSASTTVKGQGIEVTVGGSAAKAVPFSATDFNKTNATTDATKQLAEKLYGDDLRIVAGASNDFGYPADHAWSYKVKGAYKTVYTVRETPVATFTKTTKAADVAAALEGYSFKYNNTTPYEAVKTAKLNSAVTLVANDYLVATCTVNGTAKAATYLACGAQKVATYLTGLTTTEGNRVDVFVDDDGYICNIALTNYTFGKLTAITKTSAQTGYTFSTGASGYEYTDANVDPTIEFVGCTATKGDYYTFASCSGVLYVYPVTTVTGTQTASSVKDAVQTITVDGTSYVVAEYTGHGTFGNGSSAANYYIDQFGYAIYTDAVVAKDFAYVVSTTASNSKTVDGANASVSARVVLSDGTVGTYTVATEKVTTANSDGVGDTYYQKLTSAYTWPNNRAVTTSRGVDGAGVYLQAGDVVIKNLPYVVYDGKDANNSDANAQTVAANLEGKVFTYTLKDSTITLKPIAAATASMSTGTNYTFQSNAYVAQTKTSYTNSTATALANAGTKFVVYNADKKTAEVITGTANLPAGIVNKNVYGDVVLTVSSDSVATGTASYIFVVIDKAVDAVATDNYAYVDISTETVTGTGSDAEYSYTAYKKDGSEMTITSTSQVAASGIYLYNTDDSIGASKALVADGLVNTFYIGCNTSTKVQVEDDLLLAGNGEYYNITDETVFVYVDSTLASVDDNLAYVVLAPQTTNSAAASNDIATVYVIGD